MFKRDLDSEKLIPLKDVLIDKAEPDNITSVQRLRKILDYTRHQEEYGIIQVVYFPKMKNKGMKLKPLKIIWESILREIPWTGVAYSDGGFEFLNKFIKKKGVLFYENKLVLPNNQGLVFHHPVKNENILEKLVLS